MNIPSTALPFVAMALAAIPFVVWAVWSTRK